MKKMVRNLIDKTVGKVGDKQGEKICAIVLYQPKVCKREKK